ncbi:MAG TPA: hypothetical protein VI911_00705 [Patescibacteria group bacterium]|nr:MAG: hypothetical protein A2381_03100 [Bdellovibrionales bacterium RIFOXYB1_FULL_37_110]HLD89538.1 hypothetical protein [Patescibacteria group bacterium]
MNKIAVKHWIKIIDELEKQDIRKMSEYFNKASFIYVEILKSEGRDVSIEKVNLSRLRKNRMITSGIIIGLLLCNLFYFLMKDNIVEKDKIDAIYLLVGNCFIYLSGWAYYFFRDRTIQIKTYVNKVEKTVKGKSIW